MTGGGFGGCVVALLRPRRWPGDRRGGGGIPGPFQPKADCCVCRASAGAGRLERTPLTTATPLPGTRDAGRGDGISTGNRKTIYEIRAGNEEGLRLRGLSYGATLTSLPPAGGGRAA